MQGHVDEVVRTSVEETLNTMLEAEADQLCQTQRDERSPNRAETRAGHDDRKRPAGPDDDKNDKVSMLAEWTRRGAREGPGRKVSAQLFRCVG